MEAEISRILTVKDPNLADNTTIYVFKDREYKKAPPGAIDNLAVHFTMDGCLLHNDSEEAKWQKSNDQKKKDEMDELRKQAMEIARKEAEEGEV